VKPVYLLYCNSSAFSGYSSNGTGSFPISISFLFSKGTQPKLTKIPVSIFGFYAEEVSLSIFLIAVMNGANTKYPSFPSLYLLIKNLSSLK